MDVIEVSISQMRETPACRRVCGVVSLVSGGRNIVLQCDAPIPDTGRSRAALLRDAFRQLDRMPEHRNQAQRPQRKLIAAPQMSRDA
ncbi:hypothetical protein ACSSNL_09965 [Thalassobius sp. S69A]|uniref:hypothetical protein n=1 Tax=unclassified Thalassovita TaxID=2619711 RepID=UPI000C5ED7E5|nr:hypothetical protein [Paracoccaceae bacterium]